MNEFNYEFVEFVCQTNDTMDSAQLGVSLSRVRWTEG